jgi:S-formylglutathione hydrolase FrmB
MSSSAPQSSFPVLYLLHGLSDDHTIWQRRTSIERYVSSLGIAVVMPNVSRSFYTDMVHGYPYWTFVSQELPEVVRGFFPISAKRDDNFVAGLSMGGYGAFKLALRCPEQFSYAASLSGALDIVGYAARTGVDREAEFHNIFGDPTAVQGSDNDLFTLANHLKAKGQYTPKLYQCCGTEDFLYEDNVAFKQHAEKLGLDLYYEEGPGNHEWGYWDRQIQSVLRWIALEDKLGEQDQHEMGDDHGQR